MFLGGAALADLVIGREIDVSYGQNTDSHCSFSANKLDSFQDMRVGLQSGLVPSVFIGFISNEEIVKLLAELDLLRLNCHEFEEGTPELLTEFFSWKQIASERDADVITFNS